MIPVVLVEHSIQFGESKERLEKSPLPRCGSSARFVLARKVAPRLER